jgi:chromatin remodeling complex protein RSC6
MNEIGLAAEAVRLIDQNGIIGLFAVTTSAAIFLCWKLILMHRSERDEWNKRVDKLHKEMIQIISQNTSALSELSTIVKFTIGEDELRSTGNWTRRSK